MATIRELAILVADKSGRALDTTFVEMVTTRVKYWRSRLLRNTLDKDPRDRKFFLQTVTLPLEEVNLTPCVDVRGCKLWRTKIKVPLPLRANNILFDYAGSIDGSNPFKYVMRHELAYLLTNKYMKLVTEFYAYEDGYVYADVPFITLKGVWDDPEAVIEAACGGSTDCDVADQDFGISGEIAQLIVQSILQIDFAQPKQDDKPEEEVDIP